jgi:ubiquitin C-terminal hydrolase
MITTNINKIEMTKIKEQNDNLINDLNKTKKFNDIKIKFDDIQNNDPLKLYVVPTLIGLNNIGDTCFMNSTLQCLSQTKDLANFCLKQKNLEKAGNNNKSLNNKSNCRLYSSFLELIQKLWDQNGPKSFSPTEFMNLVNEMNPLFKTGQAGDAKDFIIFVLEQLHKELVISVNINNNTNLEPLNQYDKNSSFNYFFKDFKNQVSIISDIFYGFIETTNECLNCKNIYDFKGLINPICYNYRTFNYLIFPLEKVKNFKN